MSFEIPYTLQGEKKKGNYNHEKLLPPGTLRMTSCPTRRIWIGSIEGCTQINVL